MPPHTTPWTITLTAFAQDAGVREYASLRNTRAMIRHVPEGQHWLDVFPRRYGLAHKGENGLDHIPAMAAIRLKIWASLREPDERPGEYQLAFLSFPVIALLTGCRHNSIVSAFTRSACRSGGPHHTT
ncbi:MAG: hypothetical protein IT469_01780 [Pseudomonadales bacterium]|nr:hypothetical protein [Pseudomonadales bacterium]